ncbi:MAG: type II toxin-antitoxin system HicB family antitoxin [Actinomycetota bacterium]|nr:type II toxin-antitoxin system HicB family antitoxin [Actinomycetota bacterium]
MAQTVGFSGRSFPVPTDESSGLTDDMALYLTRQTLREFSKADRGHPTAMPTGLIDRYVLNAVRLADVEAMEDGRFYAEIPGIQGVWADGDSVAEVCEELDAALRTWLDLKIKNQDRDIPKVSEIDLNVL